MKNVTLNDGNEIPQLGFGTYLLTGEDAYRSVLEALRVGYRHIDTADRYGNHDEVKRAIIDSSIDRNELFLTSKVWFSDLRSGDLIESSKRFLDELSIEYLDLLLVHWPNRNISLSETFNAFEKLKESGVIRSYGVSNYTINHLNDVLDEGFMPVINQVELHPTLSQPYLNEFCDDHNIVITAYSPLAQGADLKEKLIGELAEKYDKSGSQVIINWLIQKNIIAIPRSSNKDHIKDNFEALSWELSEEDVGRIDGLDRNNRVINPSFSDFEY